jgi:transcriptional regulator with XRE-family HTH domain
MNHGRTRLALGGGHNIHFRRTLAMNLVELAQRIRAARTTRGMTLEQVSEASGLAKGLLSKVENFRVTPTLPTLAKLCETLGVKLSELVDGLEEKPRLCTVRKDQRKVVVRDGGQSNIVYQSLAHGRANRAMDPFELVIPAHGGRQQPMPHEGEEFLMVLKGKVEFEFDGTVQTLNEGDSVYFDAETDHRVFNVTSKDARVLCVFLEHGN